MIRVCCIVKNGSKILLVRQGKNRWICPGFKFEGDLSIVDITKHYMKKFNLDVKVGGIVHIHTDGKKNKTYFLNIPEFSGEVKNTKWFDIKELDKQNLDTGQRFAIERKIK